VDTLLYLGLSNAALAGVLALAVGAAGPLLRQRPALAHGLWLLVLLKLLTPPLVQAPLPWPTEPEAQPGPIRAAASDFPDPEAPAMLVAEAGAQGEAPLPDQEATIPALPSWQSLVLGIWLTVSLLWWALAGWRIVRFQRLLRVAELAPETTQEQARRLAQRLGLRRCPAVYLVPAAVSPLVWTLGRRACLLLPALLWQQLSDSKRDTLLAHELAHLRRRDHWVRWFELVVVGLYWWHPAVWWARRQLHEAEEQCCDAWVVWALPGSGPTYAAALVETVAFLAQSRAALPVAASGAGQVRTLKWRLTMILRNRPPRSLSAPGLLALVGLAALVLPLVPSWAGPAVSQETPPAEPQVQTKTPSPQPKPGFGIEVEWKDPAAVQEPPLKPPAKAAPSDVRELRDQIELLRAQIAVKKAAIAVAQAEWREVESKRKRIKELAKVQAVDQRLVDEVQAQAAVALAKVHLKEAELQEAQVRLQRLVRLLGETTPAPMPAPRGATDPKRLQDLERKLLELQRAIESLRRQLPPRVQAPHN
jgi:beta-lactamase regulating signal transducer with metallopeptidase domain